MELETVSSLIVKSTNLKLYILQHIQTNPGQSQALLMNSEMLGLLLAQNLEGGGSNRTFVSDHIGKL